jgi:hypothetical protein
LNTHSPKEAAMFRIFGPAVQRRIGVIAIGAISVLLMGGTAHAQAPGAPSAFVFPSGFALVINVIKADKTADWEAVMEKIKEGMQKSDKPERKAQAAAWKVFKVGAPGPNGSSLYFWRFEAAAPDADFSVSKLMQELYPTEAVALYKQYSDCYVSGHQIFQLTLVNDFGK